MLFDHHVGDLAQLLALAVEGDRATCRPRHVNIIRVVTDESDLCCVEPLALGELEQAVGLLFEVVGRGRAPYETTSLVEVQTVDEQRIEADIGKEGVDHEIHGPRDDRHLATLTSELGEDRPRSGHDGQRGDDLHHRGAICAGRIEELQVRLEPLSIADPTSEEVLPRPHPTLPVRAEVVVKGLPNEDRVVHEGSVEVEANEGEVHVRLRELPGRSFPLQTEIFRGRVRVRLHCRAPGRS